MKFFIISSSYSFYKISIFVKNNINRFSPCFLLIGNSETNIKPFVNVRFVFSLDGRFPFIFSNVQAPFISVNLGIQMINDTIFFLYLFIEFFYRFFLTTIIAIIIKNILLRNDILINPIPFPSRKFLIQQSYQRQYRPFLKFF